MKKLLFLAILSISTTTFAKIIDHAQLTTLNTTLSSIENSKNMLITIKKLETDDQNRVNKIEVNLSKKGIQTNLLLEIGQRGETALTTSMMIEHLDAFKTEKEFLVINKKMSKMDSIMKTFKEENKGYMISSIVADSKDSMSLNLMMSSSDFSYKPIQSTTLNINMGKAYVNGQTTINLMSQLDLQGEPASIVQRSLTNMFKDLNNRTTIDDSDIESIKIVIKYLTNSLELPTEIKELL